MKRLEFWIIGGVLIVATMLILAFSNRSLKYEGPKNKTYTVTETWELPDVLEEVSGIAWLGNDELATVEDEDGTIFIYNLKSKEITDEIDFAGAGDYEDIAVNGTTAYILRSDGKLYEVSHFRAKDKKVKSYKLSIFEDSNMESLAFDESNQRLLLAPKDEDPNDRDYKGIYSFSLEDHQLEKNPVMKIDMKRDEFKDFQKKKDYKTLRPSALAINPQNKDLYVLEGVNPKLLVFDAKGVLKDIHIFDSDEFAQAEGLTFGPGGDLYISNESNKNPANILKVSLK